MKDTFIIFDASDDESPYVVDSRPAAISSDSSRSWRVPTMELLKKRINDALKE